MQNLTTTTVGNIYITYNVGPYSHSVERTVVQRGAQYIHY